MTDPGLWNFSLRPDLGPMSDEYLEGCLSRTLDWEEGLSRPDLLDALGEDGDGDGQ